ncbi:PQQ-binding-like beta-propeller repeat protein [Streptomyces syringium]|uniref:outer membrane protein assembly factor BamB family protein n=1 Tax=Streptomyces syringium TaxID=76729 RepID=UPI00365359AD
MTQPPSYGYPHQPPSAPLPPVTPPPLPPYTGSGPSAPSPSSGPPAWRKPALIGLVLAVLLAAGGWALWAFTGDDSSGSKKPAATAKGPAAGRVAWMAEARTKPDKDNRQALGTWFTSSLVVKAEPDMVTAYDIRTGAKKWSFLLQGPLCSASRESEGNVAVIAAKFGSVCTHLMAVDLRSGKRIWEELLVPEKDAGDSLTPGKWAKANLELALHDGHVYAIWGNGEQTRRLKDGKRIEEEKRDSCEMVDSAGGDRLIAITYCGSDSIKIRSINPKKLEKSRWSRTIKRNDGFLSIISTDPLVLSQAPGNGGPDNQYDFVVLDPENGKEKARVGYNTLWQRGNCFLATSGCTGALVTKESLYVAGRGVTMAYDLSSGKERWTFKADANRLTVPVSVRKGRLAAYTFATPDRPGRISYVTTSTGKAERTVDHTGTSADLKNETLMAKSEGFPRLTNDRLLLVNDGGFADEDSGMILAISAPDDTQ